MEYSFDDILKYIENDKEWDAPDEVKAMAKGLTITTFYL